MGAVFALMVLTKICGQGAITSALATAAWAALNGRARFMLRLILDRDSHRAGVTKLAGRYVLDAGATNEDVARGRRKGS